MQKRMKFIQYRLYSGQSVKLHAFGLAIGTAVWMAITIRNQLGGVTQKASILELKDEEKQRESFGIEIILSRSLDAPVKTHSPKAHWVKKNKTDEV